MGVGMSRVLANVDVHECNDYFQEDGNLHDEWVKQYGPTIKYAGILGVRL